jgi:hypothetical protein
MEANTRVKRLITNLKSSAVSQTMQMKQGLEKLRLRI